MNARLQHILVVDDQADNLLILEDLLGADYRVHTVDSSEKALDYFTLGHPAFRDITRRFADRNRGTDT